MKTFLILISALLIFMPEVMWAQDVFLSDWSPRTMEIPNAVTVKKPLTTPTTQVSLRPDSVLTKISKYIFGSNANTYSGQMQDEVLLNNIIDLSPNILRFPGGTPSDVFFWDRDLGDLPDDIPDSVYVSSQELKSNYFWFGQNPDWWTLALDSFYLMLEKTNSTGMITVNYGYARYGTSPDPVAKAAHHAANWVRYDAGRTKYWEVGNENYGEWEPGWKIDTKLNKDGQPQIINGGLYGEHFKVFADSMRAAAKEIGVTIEIGAVLVSWAKEWDTRTTQEWNERYFLAAGNEADFYSVHNYFTGQEDHSPFEILNWSSLNVVDSISNYVSKGFKLDGIVPKPIAMTEWNIFSKGSGQKTSHISGVHATIVVGEMLKKKVSMAARFELLATNRGGDDGDGFATFNIGDPFDTIPWNPRPYFFYMKYFQKVIGDKLIASSVDGSSNIISYSSSYSSGDLGVVLVNKGTIPETVNVEVDEMDRYEAYYFYVLEGDNNDFSQKVRINGVGPLGDYGGPREAVPAKRSMVEGGVHITVPGYGAVYVLLAKKKDEIRSIQKLVAHAGTDQSIQLPVNSAYLKGAGIAGNSDIAGYLWTKLSGPFANFVDKSSSATTVYNLSEGTYYFELSVTDRNGISAKDTMQLIVKAPERIPPVADAGQDKTYNYPVDEVALDGKGYGNDQSSIKFSWRQLSGPNLSSILEVTSARTKIRNLLPGTYHFELTVKDQRGLSAKDTVNYTITPTKRSLNNKSIKLYPNPVKNFAVLSLSNIGLNSNVSLMLVDSFGRRAQLGSIKHFYNSRIEINLSKFRTGFYTLIIESNTGKKYHLAVLKL